MDVNGNESSTKPTTTHHHPSSRSPSVISVRQPESGNENLLGQWSAVTGWHGINDAYLARGRALKIMWIVVVLATMTVGMNQCVSLLMDFFKEDRWTSSISSRLVESLPVPGLYVCSLNMYNQSAFAENGLTAAKVIENAGSNANIPQTIMDSFKKPEDDFAAGRPHTTMRPNGRFPGGFQQGNPYGQFGQNGQFGPGGAGQGGFPGGPGGGFGQNQNQNQNGDQQQQQQQQVPGGFQGGAMGGIGAQGMGSGQAGGQQGVGSGQQGAGDQTGMSGQVGGYGGQQQGGGMGGMGRGGGMGAGGGMGGGGMGGGGMGGGGMGGGGFGRKRRQASPKKATKTPTSVKASKVTTASPNTKKPPAQQSYDDLYGKMENATMQCSSMIIGCGSSSELTWDDKDSNNTILTDQCCIGTQMDEDSCTTVNLTPAFSNMLKVENGEIEVANSENSIFLLMDPRLGDYMKELIAGERPGEGFRLYFGVGYDAKSYSKPILISPSTYSLIELTFEQTKTLLNRERGITGLVKTTPPCRTVANYTYVIQKDYQKWACEADCQMITDIQLCGCTVVEGDFRPQEKYCDNVTARFWCKRRVTIEKNKPDSLYHKCKMDCRDSCDWKSISSIVSTTQFPALTKVDYIQKYLNQNGRNFSREQIQNLALVEIYYGSLFVRETERSERITINELISNLGGALGAWAGISLITIYQAIVYLIMGCFDWMAERRAREAFLRGQA